MYVASALRPSPTTATNGPTHCLHTRRFPNNAKLKIGKVYCLEDFPFLEEQHGMYILVATVTVWDDKCCIVQIKDVEEKTGQGKQMIRFEVLNDIAIHTAVCTVSDRNFISPRKSHICEFSYSLKFGFAFIDVSVVFWVLGGMEMIVLSCSYCRNDLVSSCSDGDNG